MKKYENISFKIRDPRAKRGSTTYHYPLVKAAGRLCFLYHRIILNQENVYVDTNLNLVSRMLGTVDKVTSDRITKGKNF